MAALIPYADAQKYLKEKHGLPSYSKRHQRLLITQGRFPPPIEMSVNRKAYTPEQLDRYAQGLLAQAAGSVDAAD
jgi:hypothetical protein